MSCLLTFCDGGQPIALEALKKDNIPHKKYFKFNNSALFGNNDTKDKFVEMFWEMG